MAETEEPLIPPSRSGGSREESNMEPAPQDASQDGAVMIAGIPVLFPPDLLKDQESNDDRPPPENHEEGSSDDQPPGWWVCRTLTRQEKVVAKRLVQMRAPFYLPLIKHKSIQRGRARVSHVPMFPGYLFVFGGAEERLNALRTNRLAGIERVADGETLRRDLQQIQRLIEGDAPITACQRVGPGRAVRIKEGPFEGVEGVVVKRRKKSELLVAVNYLQQGARMAVEDWMIEPIE